MINLNTMKYNSPILLLQNESQRIYIDKTFFKELNCDQYFIKVYQLNKFGSLSLTGYMYFCVDFENKISFFIGTYIKPKYRSQGISSLLISCWIQVCFANHIFELRTIRKQRKPFILFTLKGFSFEIDDQSLYNSLEHTIYICKNSNDYNDFTKYLLFKNPIQERRFINSSIGQEDNYQIINSVSSSDDILDEILLSVPYNLFNDTEAYLKSESKINGFKR